MSVTVTAPNPAFSGVRCGLPFHQGQAVSADALTPRQEAFFTAASYTITHGATVPLEAAEPAEPAGPAEPVDASARPGVRSSRADWEAHATHHGHPDPSQASSKDDLISWVDQLNAAAAEAPDDA